jgi:YidC/Oxa1 family membrane protein insertase
MQQKASNLNLLLFIVLSTLILFGTMFLQSRFFPPRRPLPPEARVWSDLSIRTSGTVLASGVPGLVPGLGGAAQFYANATTAQWLADRGYRLPLLAKQAAKPDTPPKPQVVKKTPAKAAKHEEITLGGESFNLTAKVTSRGAGVTDVVLNEFKGADALGRPEDSSENLIPENVNHDSPSDLLYHFAKPGDDEPQEELANLDWTLERKEIGPDNGRHEVEFSADIPGQPLRIFKTYTLAPDDYHIGLAIRIENKGTDGESTKFRYALDGAHGLPVEGQWYTYTFRNAMIGTVDPSGHVPPPSIQDSASIATSGGKVELKGKNWIQYAGVAIQYFASMLVVDDQQADKGFLLSAIPKLKTANTQKPQLSDITVRVVAEADLKPGGQVTHKYLLYNGPVKVRLLGQLTKGRPVPPAVVARYETTLHLNTLTDHGRFLWWSDLLIYCTNIMHWILGGMFKVLPNYGLCIILLTVLVRAIMHPVSRKQARTSIKMQALVPELKKLQAEHKNDKQAMAAAQMALYRKHGVSPIGSCWVIFLQMPIFLGLYYCLQESILFRLAPFLWMRNLAAPDMLIKWGENIPIISHPIQLDGGGFLGSILNGLFRMFYLGPFFNLLPVIAVVLMILQQKFLMPPPTDETQEMQQKMMKYMMVFFGVMFYKVAAGLCIYFIVSSLWGMTERKLLPKAKPAAAPGATAGGPSGGAGRPVPPRPKARSPKEIPTNGAFKKVQEMWSELLRRAEKK